MRTRKRFSKSLSAAVLATCLVLPTAPAWAQASFPAGLYSAKGVTATMTFDGKGQLRVRKGGVLKVEASYAVNGDQIELSDKHGPWACMKPGQRTGAFHWKYDNGVLTFTKVADACKDRSDSLTRHDWKKR